VIVEVPAEITDAIKTQTNNMGTLINAMAEVKTEVKTHTTELTDLRSEVKQLKETAITPRRMNSRIEKALAVHSAVVDVRMLGAINKASRRLKDEVETQIIGDDPEKPAPDKNPVKSPATNTRSAISPAKRRLSDPGPAAALKKPSTKK
jgi:regulator of replication initiation timing